MVSEWSMKSTMFIGRTVVACAASELNSNASSAGTCKYLLNVLMGFPFEMWQSCIAHLGFL